MRSLPFLGLWLVAAATALPAQRVLHVHALPPGQEPRTAMRPAGDTDGDGTPDFVAIVRDQSNPGQTTWSVVIASGADGRPLHVLPVPTEPQDAVGFGDANLDGRSDVAIATFNELRVHSGLNGALLYAVPAGSNGGYVSVDALGDWNGDLRADLVALTYNTGISHVRLLQGQNGAPLPATQPSVTNYRSSGTVRNVGDLNLDGKDDVAVCTENAGLHVLQTNPPLQILTTPYVGGFRDLRVADLDGDGIAELLVYDTGPQVGGVEVLDARTGAVRLTLRPTPGVETGILPDVTAVGDLDADGTGDLVAAFFTAAGQRLRALSGSTGRELWRLESGSLIEVGAPLDTVGDLDGDGIGDLAVRGAAQVGTDGWLVVSGRVLADVVYQSGACGGGPFLPRLGMTRPILGAPLTVVGSDGPPATAGLLLFSLRPSAPLWLGASTCVAWFAYGSAAIVQPLAAPQWTFTATLPTVPQLAGVEVALQSYYAPTAGPLGYDLSNGLWARVGYP